MPMRSCNSSILGTVSFMGTERVLGLNVVTAELRDWGLEQVAIWFLSGDNFCLALNHSVAMTGL